MTEQATSGPALPALRSPHTRPAPSPQAEQPPPHSPTHNAVTGKVRRGGMAHLYGLEGDDSSRARDCCRT